MSKKFSDGKNYKVIAFCLTKFKDSDQVKIINELCNNCKKAGIKVMIFTSVTDLFYGGINDIGEGYIFSSFDVSRFDAIVIMSETFKHSDVLNDLVKRSLLAKVPVISIDRKLNDCINIEFDYEKAFEKIVRHVVEKHGARKINFIAGLKDNSFSEDRLAAYKRVLKEHGIPYEPERVGYGNFWAAPTRAVVEDFLKSDLEFPEAIICANDYMAIECMRTLKHHGYKIPEDIIVTGFDGVELEKFYSPRLTTAEFDVKKLRDTIFQAVYDNTDGKTGKHNLLIEHKYRLGSSCGCKNLKTEDVEEQLYLQKFEMDDKSIFIQNMYNMVAKLSNYPDLHYIFNLIPDYFKRAECRECFMCFNSDFIDEEMNVKQTFCIDNDNYSHYTKNMRVPMHFLDDMVYNEPDFDISDLVPDIDNVLNSHDYLMFVPIHLQGYTVGYMSCSFDVEKFKFSYYQSFLLNFRHILEIYVNRTTQERLYVCDVLTKIYNRHGFYRNIGEIMKNSKRKNLPFTIMSIDMDGLKQINDTYGHAEGDFAIRTIAECMTKSTNFPEICSRFGGDEFLIAFCDERGKERAEQIWNSITNLLEGINLSGEKPYDIKASCGIYSESADKTLSLDDFIRYADNLMYENKKLHKSGLQ